MNFLAVYTEQLKTNQHVKEAELVRMVYSSLIKSARDLFSHMYNFKIWMILYLRNVLHRQINFY